jgi:hypothetical protein
VDLDRAREVQGFVRLDVGEDLPVALGLDREAGTVADLQPVEARTSTSRTLALGHGSGQGLRRVRMWSNSGREAVDAANLLDVNAPPLSVTSLIR